MAPLVVLLVTFAILFAVDRYLTKGKLGISFVGRAAMSAMLLVTGIAHFTNTEQMVAMMPDVIPAKRELAYFTGICEFAAMIGLLWRRTAWLASVLLIVFFIAVLPANIAGALKRVPLGGMDLGPWYLLFRIPLQIFFIWWVYYFGIRRNSSV